VTSLQEVHAVLTAPGSRYEMEQIEVDGVPIRRWKNALRSLRDVLELSRAHGDRPFLTLDGKDLSFEDHYRRVAALATYLQESCGIRAGDRVAIAMRNLPEWSVAFWATLAIGGVVVGLNAWWSGAELEYGRADADAKLLIADTERLDRIAPFLGNLAVNEVILVDGNGSSSEPAVKVSSFSDVVGVAADESELPSAEIDPDAPATIFYSSGTTGLPKGVVSSHRNVCQTLMSLGFGYERATRLAGGGEGFALGTTQSAYLLSVPFFHSTGSHSILVSNAIGGGRIVLMRKWDPRHALELISQYRITTFGGVPTIAWDVVNLPDLERYDLASVSSVGFGGGPAAPELVRRLQEFFPGRNFSNGWGLTESTGGTTMIVGAEYLAHPGSVGAPFAVCDLKVVDERGEARPVGQVGELWIRGPNVALGYWGKPAETEETFGGGWLRSGDAGYVDQDGYVYIVDRIKDMLIRGGENVYCVEVEACLLEHPAVAEAAVVGVPHEVLGEEVGAVIRLHPDHVASVDELHEHCAGRIATFKVPTHIWFREDPFPRNAAGKIMKRDLRTEVVGSPTG
jgi:acyl-CoA synthetase (AMP-forming)/AMP-acid ligase II